MSLLSEVNATVGKPRIFFSLFGLSVGNIPVNTTYRQKLKYENLGKEFDTEVPMMRKNYRKTFIDIDPERYRAFFTAGLREALTREFSDPEIRVCVGYE